MSSKRCFVAPSLSSARKSSLIFAAIGVSVPGGAIGKVVRWAFEQQGLYQPTAAPTPVSTPGAPPDVDVYIDDGFAGQYNYLEDFWENTNIWNLLAPNPGTIPADHQTPIVGQTNYAYVNVSNRGTQPASRCACRPCRCVDLAPATFV